jgi:hypothetical protein
MTPEEERLYKVLGMAPPKEKTLVGKLIGAVIGFLLSIALFSYSFIFAFNLTLPQGLVLSWVLVLLLDAIRNGGKK